MIRLIKKSQSNIRRITRPLTTKVDGWNCLQLKLEKHEKITDTQLSKIISEAKDNNCKAIWLHSQGQPENIPVAFRHNFKFHIAHEDQYVLSSWLLDESEGHVNSLPPTITHQLGVSAVCLNKKGQILMIKDTGTVKFYGNYWKLPGGRVDLFEDLATASVRETFEECGIKTKFKSILGFRETMNHPNVPMNRSDIFYITRVELENENEDTITMCERELLDAKWVDIDKIGSKEFPVSKVGEAILSVVHDGLANGWDSVDVKMKTWEWEVDDKDKNDKLAGLRRFSFYRR